MKVFVPCGGHGPTQVLQALMSFPEVWLTVGVTPFDRGGSSGVYSKTYGSPAYGDITNCMAALSTNPALRRHLTHRYNQAFHTGHSRKNNLLFELEGLYQDDLNPDRALVEMHRLCEISIKHKVRFVTRHPAELKAEIAGGRNSPARIITGEDNIDNLARLAGFNHHYDRIKRVFLDPEAVCASAEIIDAIERADWIIIPPGSLYTSILAALAPRGMKNAFRRSSASIAVVINLMTNLGETQHFTVEDFVERIQRGTGRPCQKFIVNKTPIPPTILERYEKDGEKVQVAFEERADCLATSSNLLSIPCNDIDPSRLIYTDLLDITPEGHVRHNVAALVGVFKKLFAMKLAPTKYVSKTS